VPFDVFISYSSKDKVAADATCAALEAAGIRCWIAPRDIRAGIEYAAGIMEAIDSSRLMVLIFSTSSNASVQVHREIERAISKGLTIIPFRIEDVLPTKAMEYYLGPIHWLDAITPPLAAHLGRLVEQVKANLEVPPAAPSLGSTAPAAQKKSGWPAVTPQMAKWLSAGVAAVAVLALVSIWLWGKIETPRPATPAEQILQNLLAASYDDPIATSIPRATVKLTQLADALREGLPKELLYWLYTDSFQLTVSNAVLGYQYAPPNSLGCNKIDPKHRCYVDWIHIAALSGLTVEDKSQIANGQTITYARFCFDPFAAQQALSLVPSAIGQQYQRDLDMPPAELFGGALACGSPSWQPEKTADAPQPDALPLIFADSAVSFRIVPRSVAGIFTFLGTLLKMERLSYKPDASLYPDSRPYVADAPTLLTVHDDPKLITVVKGTDSGCFVRTRFRGDDYCVPDSATTTKHLFAFLLQLVPSQAQP
jgi:hypothetical protein